MKLIDDFRSVLSRPRSLTGLGYARARPVGLGAEAVAADAVPEVAGQRVAAVLQELHAEVAARQHEALLSRNYPN